MNRKNNFYRKDWILYQEIANEGGTKPEQLIDVNVKIDDPETNAHVPFIEETKDGYKVRTGKNKYHSETAEHHTIFIELVIDNTWQIRKYLKIGDTPDISFLAPKGKTVEAYTFCNLHGLFYFKLQNSEKTSKPAK